MFRKCYGCHLYYALFLEILNIASFEEALINMYRMYPVLYDMTLKDYKNEKMKLNFWEKIAQELQHVTGCCI